MKKLLLCSLIIALPLKAQVRTFSLDVRPLGGIVALGWRASEGTYIGMGIGGGSDEFGHTIKPNDESQFTDLEQLLHFDLFVRKKPSKRVDIDVGVRSGLGSVRVCQSSDCLPGGVLGAFAALFVGSEHWKLGTRLFGGRVWEAGDRDDVLHWEMLSLRYSR